MAFLPTLKLSSVTSNVTFVVPAGYSINQLIIESTNENAVTGGLRLGTTDGGTDVVLSLSVAGNSLQIVSDATLLKRVFSFSSDQTLYIQAVTLWNSASLNIYFVLCKLK